MNDMPTQPRKSNSDCGFPYGTPQDVIDVHNKRRLVMQGPIRQGDVLLYPIAELPAGLKKARRSRARGLVIAEGEVTGHAHCILDRTAELFVAADLDEMADRFLVVAEECELTHDEHDTLTIPPGIYRLPVQREYSPAELVRVSD